MDAAHHSLTLSHTKEDAWLAHECFRLFSMLEIAHAPCDLGISSDVLGWPLPCPLWTLSFLPKYAVDDGWDALLERSFVHLQHDF